MLSLVMVFALLQVLLAPACVVGAYVSYRKDMKALLNVCTIFALVFFVGAYFMFDLAETMQKLN